MQRLENSQSSSEDTMVQPKAECLRKLIEQNQICHDMNFNLETVKGEISERDHQIKNFERAMEAGQTAGSAAGKSGSGSRPAKTSSKKEDVENMTGHVIEQFLSIGEHAKKSKVGILTSLSASLKSNKGGREKIKRQEPVRELSNPADTEELEVVTYIEKLTKQKTEMTDSVDQLREQLVEKIGEALEAAIEAKTTLVKKDLHNWKIQQRMAQIGPKDKHEAVQSELDRMDPIFEECGDEIRKLKNTIEHAIDEIKKSEGSNGKICLKKLQEYLQQISKLIYHFVWESCIVARQPPSVMVKTGPPTSRDSNKGLLRPPCQPAIRLLGGSSLGCRTNSRAEVACQLISEEQARNVGKPGHKISPAGKLLHNVTKFELDSVSRRFFAYYSRPIVLTDMYSSQRSSEPEYRRRFYLLFSIKMTGGSMVLQAPKLSLPLIVMTEPDQPMEQKADAYIFWEHAFAEEKGILTRVPRENSPGIPWPIASKALNLKFQQLVEGWDPESQDYAIQELSPLAIEHLAGRFFGSGIDYKQCKLTWENFFEQVFLMAPGDPKPVPCPFWQWYFATADIVHRKLFKQWNKGLVQGFLGRVEAEELVKERANSMVIKFSDSTLGCLIITYWNPSDPEQKVRHLQLIVKELEDVTFEKVVRSTDDLNGIQWIYSTSREHGWQPITLLGSQCELNVPYGKRINNPYARRVCGQPSLKAPKWEEPKPPAALMDVLNSSMGSLNLSQNSEEDDDTISQHSFSFGGASVESLAID